MNDEVANLWYLKTRNSAISLAIYILYVSDMGETSEGNTRTVC